jgi:hypothetical protein
MRRGIYCSGIPDGGTRSANILICIAGCITLSRVEEVERDE